MFNPITVFLSHCDIYGNTKEQNNNNNNNNNYNKKGFLIWKSIKQAFQYILFQGSMCNIAWVKANQT